MSIAAPLPGVIRDKLSAMDRQQRELAVVRGVGEFLFGGSLAIGLCLYADRVGNLAAGWRTGLLGGLALTLLALLWFRVLRPLVRRQSWAELAAAVERRHPELTERLTTLVELHADPQRTGSPLMHDLLAKQTVKAVAQVEFTESLPAGKSLKRAALGLAALAVLLFPFLLPGGRYLLSWNRLLNPWGNYAWGSRLAFHVPDGDRVVAKGTDVTILAELQGRPPGENSTLEATLRWVDAAGQAHQRPMTFNAEDQTYSWTIPRVEQSFEYRISSRRAVSRDYRVTAAERPRVTAVKLDVQPPGYTGLPAQSLDAVVGELRVTEQSQIRFRWQFAEPVATAVMHWPQSVAEPVPAASGEAPPPARVEVPLELSEDRRSATAQLSATVSGPFEIRLTSDLGLDDEEPAHALAIIPDEPPEISVRRDELLATARPDDVLPIPTLAQDDYGLTAVELHWKTSTGQTGRQAIPGEQLTNRTVDETLTLDLSDLTLSDGQSVSCRLRAVDNRPLPSPQETWTESFEISISSQAEPLESRQVAQAQETLEQQLEALEQAVALQKQAVDTEHRDAARDAVKGDARPENQAELDQLQKRQQELREQLESLQQELESRPFLEQAAAEHAPRIEQQLNEAQQALDRAAESQGAREQIEHLSRSLDELGKAEDQLAKLKQEAKALAALEQELAELGRLARQAEKLADRAESLEQRGAEDRTANSQANGEPGRNNSAQAPQTDAARPDQASESSAPSAEELDALRQETDELAEHLDDLLRRRPELLEAARRNELERLSRLAEMAERLAEPQGRLAEALQREKNASEANTGEANTPGKTADPADVPQSQPSETPKPANENAAASEKSTENSADNPAETPADRSEGSDSPNAKQAERSPQKRALSEQIARAAERQRQLAREAAKLQSESRADRSAENGEPGEQSPGKPDAANAPNSSPLDQFAEQAQAASNAAQAGDLKQAAEQSRAAGQAARESSEPPKDGQPQTATDRQAADLAERQEALAEEFQQLAQSPAARQAAQQQSQQRMNRASDALADALEQSSQRMSQQPLELRQPSEAASEASQSAKSASDAMKQAAKSLAQGNSPEAGQQANAAQQQLQQAAQQAAQAAGEPSPASPQGAKVPGQTAGKVAQAASQLKQAQGSLGEAQLGADPGESKSGDTPPAGAQPSDPANSTDARTQSPSPKPGSPSQPGPSQPGQGDSPANEPSTPNQAGEPSAESNTPPGDAKQPASGKPGSPSSPLERTSEQLRQAAKSLSAACQACQSGKPGKPGSAPGKPGSKGQPGSQGKSESSIARNDASPSNSEPGEPAESGEGAAEFGGGNSAELADNGALPAAGRANAGARNWGRLPKNLQTEIRQGSTKKPHPEYARQIKRYFEQIAQPAEKRDRP